jgi:predicted NBD/HSP70 family sugar kinase
MSLWGGIEAGGTKFVCAVGTGPGDSKAFEEFSTTTPEKTIGRAIAFFKIRQDQGNSLEAIGIASFGPIDPNPESSTYGFITEKDIRWALGQKARKLGKVLTGKEFITPFEMEYALAVQPGKDLR